MPTHVLKSKSPLEAFIHNAPNYLFFKILGCAAYPLFGAYAKENSIFIL